MSQGFARINVDAAHALILVPLMCKGRGCKGLASRKKCGLQDDKAALR
jgi:hypothetical protein